jgi:hypothetical protein
MHPTRVLNFAAVLADPSATPRARLAAACALAPAALGPELRERVHAALVDLCAPGGWFQRDHERRRAERVAAVLARRAPPVDPAADDAVVLARVRDLGVLGRLPATALRRDCPPLSSARAEAALRRLLARGALEHVQAAYVNRHGTLTPKRVVAAKDAS